MTNETTEKASNTIIAILFVACFLAVMLLAVAIIVNAVGTANTNLNGRTISLATVTNETGFANSTGYTVSGATALNFSSPTLTALFNRTSGLPVVLANASISSLGVVTNATSIVWTNLSISYTYLYDTTSTNAYNTVFTAIITNTNGLVSNFFSLAPTIGTIFAVVILIGGIVLLVVYVRRMKDQGSDSQMGYTG